MRQLSSSATKCIKVRESLNDTEKDIGFKNGFLDIVSLLAFVGLNSGYVVKWYNQGYGGATYDAIQPAQVNQPRIVDSGVLDINPDTGLASPYFDYSLKYLTINQMAVDFSGALTDRSSFVVAKSDDTADRVAFAMGNNFTDNPFISYWRSINGYNVAFRGDSTSIILLNGGGTDTDTKLITSQLRTGIASKLMSRDGVLADTSTANVIGNYTLNKCSIGGMFRSGLDFSFKGYIDEVIFRGEFSATDRQDIDDNITTYYGI